MKFGSEIILKYDKSGGLLKFKKNLHGSNPWGKCIFFFFTEYPRRSASDPSELTKPKIYTISIEFGKVHSLPISDFHLYHKCKVNTFHDNSKLY